MERTGSVCAKNVRNRIVKLAVAKITEYVDGLTFDEIVEIIPKVMDHFDDDQLDILIAEIHRHRIIH